MSFDVPTLRPPLRASAHSATMPVARRRTSGALPVQKGPKPPVRVQKQIKRPRATERKNPSGRALGRASARGSSVTEPREVLDRRRRGNGFEFKIQWVGESAAQATWCVRAPVPAPRPPFICLSLWLCPVVDVVANPQYAMLWTGSRVRAELHTSPWSRPSRPRVTHARPRLRPAAGRPAAAARPRVQTKNTFRERRGVAPHPRHLPPTRTPRRVTQTATRAAPRRRNPR